VQIGGQCRLGAVAADRALQRVDRHDIAGAFPDRAEMGIAQQPRGDEFLDIPNAPAHLQRVAADLSGISASREILRSASGFAATPPRPGCRPSARSSASAVTKLIDSACSVAA
jgi:hypothetical protein